MAVRTVRRWWSSNAEPAVELVENVLDDRIQLVRDLRLALALAGSLPGLADDDLEHAGQRGSLQPGDLPRDGGGVANGGGQGSSQAVDQFQRQPVDGRANGRQVAEFAPPQLRRDVADTGDGGEDEVADGSGRGGAGRPDADQLAQPVLDLSLAVGDQVFLGRKVVVDGLLSDLGRARHVGDGDLLITALSEQAGGSVSDMSPGPLLLALAQSGADHASKFSEGALGPDCTLQPGFGPLIRKLPRGPL